MTKKILTTIVLIWCNWSTAVLVGQERFQLKAPELGIYSDAELTRERLSVRDNQGAVTEYLRERTFDSSDGLWRGYFNASLGQVIRWPLTNAGNMMIGTVRGQQVTYRHSQMAVYATASPPGGMPTQPAEEITEVLPPPNGNRGEQNQRESYRPVLPPIGLAPTEQLQEALGSESKLSDYFSRILTAEAAQLPEPRQIRLVHFDSQRRAFELRHDSQLNLNCQPFDSRSSFSWWILPAHGNYLRIASYSNGRLSALATSQGKRLSLQPRSNSANQLWFIHQIPGQANTFVLQNAIYPGLCISNTNGNIPVLAPIGFGATQAWLPILPMPNINPFPIWKNVQTTVRTNPPLPPAKVELVNSHREPLIVILGNNQSAESPEPFKISVGARRLLELPRDAGATLEEVYEVRSFNGQWQRVQTSTTIPPSQTYDVSVYVEHLQSIAIDRTGKSPNPIEDINYAAKSVGWFALPSGAALPDSSQIDLYSKAKSANNPGAVRRLVLEDETPPSQADPLRSILQEFQSVPRRKF